MQGATPLGSLLFFSLPGFMNAALIVFAKVPRPGHVKTRLTPVLTPEEAARLYRAFLQDALGLYQHLEVDTRLYLAPPLPNERPDWLPVSMELFEQRGASLGARMCKALRETFEEAYHRVCILGTDHPTLPLAFVRQAFSALDAPRSVCIGPSEDGGYYLLGMNAFYPQLFEGMTYSHDDVFSDTLARVETTDAQLTVLPRWYDVDTPTMLRRMVDDLKEEGVTAPHTQSLVETLNLEDLSTVE